MQFEPMIRARLNAFSSTHGYSDFSDDKLFEYFVNDAILRNHQPSLSQSEDTLLEACSVGGADDMGIDGLAIKVNDRFVSSIREAKDLVTLYKQITVDFIFIQSKNKDKYDAGEFGKFADGVKDFLKEEQAEPYNQKIGTLLSIKNYLFSDDVILSWTGNPRIWIYYVIFGSLRECKHIDAKAKTLKEEIEALKSYQPNPVRFIDSSELRRICGENENSFSVVINAVDSFGLTEVAGVDNSIIALFPATELIKILQKDDLTLRQSLFSDNVRDYQGETSINSEIMDTIQYSPSNFALLNNGITIVCSSVLSSNRKITLRDPQIVNGCQTCTVIFDAHTAGIDLSNVSVLAKVIATESEELTTTVIRGTNSQNVVESEAFETARIFHKNLEEFFNTYQKENSGRIYYERRANQYYRNSGISPGRVIALKALTQSFVSVFMQAPHLGSSHEALLLKKYKNSIFVDGQSLLPYYTAALMCLNFEELRRAGKIKRDLENRKHLLMFVISEMIGGVCPSINVASKIDPYAEKILAIVKNADAYAKAINDANNKLKDINANWVKRFGRESRFDIYENKNYTDYIKISIRGGNPDKVEFEESNDSIELRGRVIKVRKDRNGFAYGFIEGTPRDVFFHENDNPTIDFRGLYGRSVLYRIFQDSRTGIDRAEIISVI